MKVIKVHWQGARQCGKRDLPSLDVRATDADACDIIIEPRTTPDDVRNGWEEVVKPLTALIHVHRNMYAANYGAEPRQAAVRIAAMMLDCVAVSGGESRKRRIERSEMLAEALVIFDGC